LICIKCKGSQAHRSHRSGFRDGVYRLFQLIPYRCRGCQARFYAYRAGEQSAGMRTAEERKVMALRRRLRWKHTKKAVVLFGVGAAILMVCLYVITRQRVE
jgi:hypothetical protein